MKTLYELAADPEFQKMSYKQQQYVRSELFKRDWQSDPTLRAMNSQQLEATYQGFVNAAPVFKGINPYDITSAQRAAYRSGIKLGGTKDEYLSLYDAIDRMEAGDERAAYDAQGWIVGNAALNESLIAKVFMGVAHLGELARGETGPAAINRYALNTLSEYAMTKMNRDMQQKTRTGQAVGRLAVGLPENMVLNMVLFGNGNVIKEGAKAATGIVGSPGIFTQRLFGASGAFTRLAANAGTKGLTTLFQKWAPMAVEAVGGGLVDVLRNFPDLVQQGKIEGPAGFWKNFGSTFGQGVAWDFGTNLAGDALKQIALPFFRTFMKMDLGRGIKEIGELERLGRDLSTENMDSVMQAIVKGDLNAGVLRTLSPEVQGPLTESIARSRVLQTVGNLDVRSREGLSVMAKAVAGVDLEETGQGVFKLFRDGDVLGTAHTPEAALDLIGHLGRTRFNLNDEIIDIAGRKAGSLGGYKGARISRRFQTPAKAVDAFSPERLAAQIPVGGAAADVERQTKGVATQLLKRAGVPFPDTIAATMPANVWGRGSGAGAESGSFFTGLRSWIKEASGRNIDIPDLSGGLRASKRAGLSVDGLEVVVRDRLGGTFQKLGNDHFRVQIPGLDGAPTTIEAFNLHDLNARLGEHMVDLGLVDEEEFGRQLYEHTGKMLQLDDAYLTETGVRRWQVRLPDGTTQGGPLYSLKEVSSAFPDFSFKLPGSFGPELYLEGEKAYFSKAFMTGPMTQIREVMGGFKGTGKSAIEWIDDAGSKIKKKLTGSNYILEIPGQGFRREFASFDSAKKYLDSQADGFENLSALAAERGYKINALRNGDLVAGDAAGKAFPLRNRAEIDAFLAQAPDPDYAPELVKSNLGEAVDQAIIDKASFHMQQTFDGYKNPLGGDGDGVAAWVKQQNAYRQPKTAFGRGVKELELTFRQWFGPRYSTADSVAELIGDTRLAKELKDYSTASQLYNASMYRSSQAMEKIFSLGGKNISRLESKIIGQLHAIPEEAWEKTIRALDPKADVNRVMWMSRASKALYKAYGLEFGIDAEKWLTHYRPKIQNARSIFQDLSLDEDDKVASLKKIYGEAPEASREVSFFADHSRLDSFVESGMVDDVVSQLQWYVQAGTRQKYLGAALSEIRTHLQTPALIKDQRVGGILQGLYSLAVGDSRSAVASGMQMQALRTTKGISDSLQSLGKTVFKDSPHALAAWEAYSRDFVNGDPLGKVSSLMSHAALGFRPMRALVNQMQFHQNVIPFFGDATAERAIAELGTDKLADFFRRGIISERGLSKDDIIGLSSKFWKSSMAAQQVSEYQTRGWTALAAEITFNEALTKYGSGIIDESGFMKYTKAGMLAQETQTRILSGMKAGNFEGARDIYESELTRILMGDYSKENYPDAFRGIVGRLFGKFGVYGINQADLYRRVLQDSSGNLGERVWTMTRMVATSYAIYNGFRMAGIDYKGFRPYDFAGFSGGPLFQAGYQVLQIPSAIIDPEDRQAQDAVRELGRNFLPVIMTGDGPQLNVPRLLVPGGLQIASTLKAGEAAGEGDYWTAFIRSLGGTPVQNFANDGFTPAF